MCILVDSSYFYLHKNLTSWDSENESETTKIIKRVKKVKKHDQDSPAYHHPVNKKLDLFKIELLVKYIIMYNR